jgi:hypothetical protein
MSIFASETTDTEPITFDPPHTFTFRKLTGREMEAAQEAHLRGFMERSTRGWASELRRLLENVKQATDAKVRAAINDPLLGYDRFVIVKAGLLSWTYKNAKPTPEQIDDLDDDAVDLMARAILKLSKPSLFLTPPELEDAQKKVSGPAPVS